MKDQMENKREVIYKELGMRYFQKHPDKVKKEEPDLAECLNELDKEIWERRIQQAKSKGLMCCPKCDLEILPDSLFCSYCGVSITEEDRTPYQMVSKDIKKEEKETKRCPNCGEVADNIEGQMFCTNCGMKLQ